MKYILSYYFHVVGGFDCGADDGVVGIYNSVDEMNNTIQEFLENPQIAEGYFDERDLIEVKKLFFGEEENHIEYRNAWCDVFRFHYDVDYTDDVKRQYALTEDTINNIIKYCEDNQIYDKLSNYGDFYYILKKIKK